jgi:DNA-binding GntR family transcriptional regulator
VKSARQVEKQRGRGRYRLETPDLGELDLDSSVSAERQVYLLLRRAIMSGVFIPGSSLTGRSIAESLGVSPTPVRDALKRLEADGVLRVKSKSAYYLIRLSRAEYLEVVALRLQVEGYAAECAARVATAADIVRIQNINDRYASTKDLKNSIRLNFQFHFEIYKLVKSKVLLDLVENLWMRIGPSMHLHVRGYDIQHVTETHRKIITALKRRDPAAARSALSDDLQEAVRAIAPLLPDETKGSLVKLKTTGVAA